MLFENAQIVATKTAADGTKIEILSIKTLSGSSNIGLAQDLFFAKEVDLSLKMVRITLNGSSVRLEPGSLYYMHGDLEIVASSGGGVLKGLSRKMLSGETFLVNEIRGKGVIILEPTFGHFLLHDIHEDEQGIIVDKGAFFGGTKDLSITAAVQRNISAALFGGEGLVQTSIQGNGIAILFSPVPLSELEVIDLQASRLSVDGNFALVRSNDIKFSVKKSSKSWVATSVSGEGLLQTFEGTGTVWLAPTQGVYKRLQTPRGIMEMSLPPGAIGVGEMQKVE